MKSQIVQCFFEKNSKNNLINLKFAAENSTPSKDLSKDLEELNGSLHGERPPASTLYPKYFENEFDKQNNSKKNSIENDVNDIKLRKVLRCHEQFTNAPISMNMMLKEFQATISNFCFSIRSQGCHHTGPRLWTCHLSTRRS